MTGIDKAGKYVIDSRNDGDGATLSAGDFGAAFTAFSERNGSVNSDNIALVGGKISAARLRAAGVDAETLKSHKNGFTAKDLREYLHNDHTLNAKALGTVQLCIEGSRESKPVAAKIDTQAENSKVAPCCSKSVEINTTANDYLSFDSIQTSITDFLENNRQYRVAYPRFSSGNIPLATLANYGIDEDVASHYDRDNSGDLDPLELMRCLRGEGLEIDASIVSGQSIVFDLDSKTVYTTDVDRAPLLDEIVDYHLSSGTKFYQKDLQDFFTTRNEGKTSKQIGSLEDFKQFMQGVVFSDMPGVVAPIQDRISNWDQVAADGYKNFVKNGKMTAKGFSFFIIYAGLGDGAYAQMPSNKGWHYFSNKQMEKLSDLFSPKLATFVKAERSVTDAEEV